MTPDRGEELALQRLHQFCADIQSFYAPGCHVLVMSDGRVFADLVGVSDESVKQYGEVLRQLLNSPNLSWDCLDNHMSGTPQQIRDILVSRWGQCPVSLVCVLCGVVLGRVSLCELLSCAVLC